MPPKPRPQSSRALLDMAVAIKQLPDGEHLSLLLNQMYSGQKDPKCVACLRADTDGSVMLGKRGDLKTTVRLDNVQDVHRFMTVTLGISSSPGNGTIDLSKAAAAAPQAKRVVAKDVTAKMYFKNPANFESLIKETLHRLGLSSEEKKKVHAVLLPAIFMTTNIKVCLDSHGEVIGMIGIDRNGTIHPRHRITNTALQAVVADVGF